MEMDYVTVAQAAEALGLTPDGVRDRIRRGDIQAVRVNPRLLMIPRAEVEKWRGRGKLKTGPKPRQQPIAAEHRRAEVEHDDAEDEARQRIHGERHDEAVGEARRRTDAEQGGQPS